MSKITYEPIGYTPSKPLCIFGCLLTDRGKQIKAEMLPWITSKYAVICINQEAPGDLFEFPALSCAKQHSARYNIPILYLHTKGAANPVNVYDQGKVRDLWKAEFIKNFEWYQHIILSDPLAVAAPFVSDAPHGITWMNGFIAGAKAWNNARVLPPAPPLGRLVYEFIFKDVEYHPYSRVFSNVNTVESKEFNVMKTYINEEKFK